MYSFSVPAGRVRNGMRTTRWSCRFCPTPRASITGAMPNTASAAASPMPESISSFGLSIVPALRITSRRAVQRAGPAGPRPSTARARPSTITTRCARTPVSTLRFGRERAGLREARAELTRLPPLTFSGLGPTPSYQAPLKSGQAGCPAAGQAAMKARPAGERSRVGLLRIGPSVPCWSEGVPSQVSIALNAGRHAS